MTVFAILTVLAPSIAGQPAVASDSPFGVVCPWPGIQDAGIRWCRVGAGATAFVNWPDIEKSPGQCDWTAADNELKQLADPLGLSLLPIFGYTPKWASRAPGDADFQFHPPKDLTQFARFVNQSVARYKHRVRVWEVWNEPNIGFFRGSAAEYAEMVKAAAVAARHADPECRIALGCAGVDLDFLQRLYEFGCGPYFDVMSVHPYQWGRQLNDGWMIDKLQGCRQLMDRHGDNHKQIWVTEVGWSLGEGVTSQEQANLLAQAVVTLLSVRERLKVEKIFWFCVKDWGGPGHGLFDVAGKPKPALVAYQAVTTELSRAQYRGSWKGPEGVRGHVFDRGGQPVLVLWASSPEKSIQVELKTTAVRLSLRTIVNQKSEATATGGRALIDVGHAPLFVNGLNWADLGPIASPASDTSPAPAAKRLPEVWLSVLPPPSTARPYFVLGRSNEFPLRIHNDARVSARGALRIELTSQHGVLASGQVPFETAAGTTQTVIWQTTLPAHTELVGQLARLRVEGVANAAPIPSIDLPVRLARSRAIEFAANSFVEGQYLHNAEKSGCSDSTRFGSEFGYRFDLTASSSAQLRINVGANAAQAWRVLVSGDGKQYATECSGKSWPAWQTISLDKHLAGRTPDVPGTIYLKIQGTDCQVREVVLEIEAPSGVKPIR